VCDVRVIERRELSAPLVGAMGVEVPSVGAKDCLGVAAVVDQNAVEAFLANGADEALRVRVTVRAARRDLQHTDVFTSLSMTASNAAVNFASRPRIRCVNRPAWSPNCHISWRACWVTHSPVG
jgi:hypothetical protein